MKQMARKILLIQPHSDDIALSCFSVIHENVDADITILTIEKNEKRSKEDLVFCSLFDNVKVIFGIEIEDLSYYEYYKKYPNEFIPSESLKYVEKYRTEVNSCIQDVLNSKHWDDIYSPLGIGHPFHYLVYDILKIKATHFYQDWPHSYKRRSKNFLVEQKLKYRLDNTFDDPEILEIKKETAKMVYKSQSSLLFFEQGNVKKNFSEKIYINK